MTYPIADMFTRIRNAQSSKKEKVIIPFSKIKYEIAKILQREGYVKRVEKHKKDDKFEIMITLKYIEDQPTITHLSCLSKPGQRIYVKKDKIPKVLGGLGLAIVSTSKGLMTDHEARKRDLGGELICKIW